MKFGVIVFPGSNCDHDCFHAVKKSIKKDVRYVWHKETDISDVDCVILPGGFSYGDYLRAGSIAANSPIINSVKEHADSGKLVIGICNGFQILLEMNLLPGAMIRNKYLKFRCKYVNLRLENKQTPFTNKMNKDAVYRIPIAHMEGAYFADPKILEDIEKNKQVIFRYTDADGNEAGDANPNGSINNIAGIVNERQNVFGMMPHPERCSEKMFGSTDGKLIFESMVKYLS